MGDSGASRTHREVGAAPRRGRRAAEKVSRKASQKRGKSRGENELKRACDRWWWWWGGGGGRGRVKEYGLDVGWGEGACAGLAIKEGPGMIPSGRRRLAPRSSFSPPEDAAADGPALKNTQGLLNAWSCCLRGLALQEVACVYKKRAISRAWRSASLPRTKYQAVGDKGRGDGDAAGAAGEAGAAGAAAGAGAASAAAAGAGEGSGSAAAANTAAAASR